MATTPDLSTTPQADWVTERARQVLRGKRTSLRTVAAPDYDFLYWLNSQPEMLIRWRYRGATPNPDAFVALLWKDVLAQFIIESTSSSQAVGLVSAYNPDLKNGTIYTSLQVGQQPFNEPFAVEGYLLLLEYLFMNWPIRKVYAEALAFNIPQFGSALGRFFTEEGRLVSHEYFDGGFHDLVILALYRDQVEDPLRRLLRRDHLESVESGFPTYDDQPRRARPEGD